MLRFLTTSMTVLSLKPEYLFLYISVKIQYKWLGVQELESNMGNKALSFREITVKVIKPTKIYVMDYCREDDSLHKPNPAVCK